MDLHEIWQENKRWILSCVAALLVYLIAHGIIEAVFGADTVRSKIRTTTREIRTEQYTLPDLRQARNDHQDNQVVYDQLLKAMHLDVPQAFRLQPGQDHELVWARRKREVADHLLDLAAEANVDLDEGSFHWPSPVERADIQRTLVGLSILDQAVQRWIRAHHEVTTAHPDAVGLRQIKRVQILAEKRRFRSSQRKDEKQPEDHIRAYTVRFEVLADYRTTDRFLESCRKSEPPLGMSELTIEQLKGRSGEPLRVKGILLGLVVTPLEEGL